MTKQEVDWVSRLPTEPVEQRASVQQNRGGSTGTNNVFNTAPANLGSWGGTRHTNRFITARHAPLSPSPVTCTSQPLTCHMHLSFPHLSHAPLSPSPVTCTFQPLTCHMHLSVPYPSHITFTCTSHLCHMHCSRLSHAPLSTSPVTCTTHLCHMHLSPLSHAPLTSVTCTTHLCHMHLSPLPHAQLPLAARLHCRRPMIMLTTMLLLMAARWELTEGELETGSAEA